MIFTADIWFFPLHPPFTFGKRGLFGRVNGKTQMKSLYRTGLEWLSEQVAKSASDEIRYLSAAGEKTLLAAYGRTEHETADDYGVKTGASVIDFIIRFKELGALPQLGDRILTEESEFEVLELNSEGCWRWCDPYQIRLRIHTTQIRGDRVWE